MNSKKIKTPASKSKPKPNTQNVRGPLQKAPVASTRLNKTVAPRVSALSNGHVRIRHREYLDDILAFTTFKVRDSLSINPGLPISFPWLSRIAINYEAYKFHALKYEYETSSATSETGRVYMAIEYDVLDSDPTTKMQMLSYKGAVACAPWTSARCLLDNSETKTLGSQRFIRSGAIANSDLKTYDVGRLIVAVQGQNTGDSHLGELYVEYDVELITPQLEIAPDSARIEGKGTKTPSAPFGTTPDILGGVVESVSGNVIHFAKIGQYLLNITGAGTDIDTISVGTTSPVDKTTESVLGTTTSILGEWSLNVRDLPASISIDTNTWTAVTSIIARLSAYNYSYS